MMTTRKTSSPHGVRAHKRGSKHKGWMRNLVHALPSFHHLGTTKAVRYTAFFLLGVIVIAGLFFITCKILFLGSPYTVRSQDRHMKMYTQPSWIPEGAFAPNGVKVVGAHQLPEGCNHAYDTCWKRAIENGLVKFVGTPAKITIPGYESRNIMFAFFRNTSQEYGSSGLYNCLPMYADDGSLVGPDIFGGITSEIDWVYGTLHGVVVHYKNSGLCYEKFFNKHGGIWSTRAVVCPK